VNSDLSESEVKYGVFRASFSVSTVFAVLISVILLRFLEGLPPEHRGSFPSQRLPSIIIIAYLSWRCGRWPKWQYHELPSVANGATALLYHEWIMVLQPYFTTSGWWCYSLTLPWVADGATALLYHEWLMVLQPYITMSGWWCYSLTLPRAADGATSLLDTRLSAKRQL